MDNQIVLRIRNNEWTATFLGEHANKIIKLFGTNEIPTPFMNDADSTYVLAVIKEKNPNCHVYIN